MLRRLVPLCLAGVLLACGGSDPDAAPAADPTATSDEVPAPPAATTAPPQPGAASSDGGVVAEVPEALQFSAPLLGGGEIELATLAGRPVLLWFWAPW